MGSEIINSDATKLAELIRNKEVSPVEVVRYEHSVKNFEALVHMACALMTLKRV